MNTAATVTTGTVTTADIVRGLVAEQLMLPQMLGHPEDDKKLREDLQADSLDMVELAMAIEDDLGILVPDGELVRLRPVGDVVAYVQGRLA